MSIFKKQQPAQRPFKERAAALRTAIYESAKLNGIAGRELASILTGIADSERQAAALLAPLPSASPKVWSGNVLPPKTPFRDLAKLIAGR